jgi:hypothetical protein
MSDGWIDRGRIVCPWHGSRCAADSGQVLRGPAIAPLPCHVTRVRNGVIELRSGANHPVGNGVARSNAYQVLFDHRDVLRGLCKEISALPAQSPQRQQRLDDLLVELDIHMRIEDDLFYPAVSAASRLVAIAHAEHRQVFDQLAVVLRIPPWASEYDDE